MFVTVGFQWDLHVYGYAARGAITTPPVTIITLPPVLIGQSLQPHLDSHPV